MKIVNLRTRRKQAARDDRRKAAAETAARHGRGKAESALEQERQDKAARELDGHRRERD